MWVQASCRIWSLSKNNYKRGHVLWKNIQWDSFPRITEEDY